MKRATFRLLALAVLAAGCASVPPPPVPVEGETERLHAWVTRAHSEGAGRRALRAEGRLHLKSPSAAGSVREVILAERPARLRLETLNPLGQTQTLLVLDGDDYLFFDGRTVERGVVSRGLLRERLGLDFEPHEAIDALLVTQPLAGEPDGPVLAQGEVRIVEDGTHRLRFSPQGDLIGVEALDASGAVRWSATYDRWRDAGDGRYPFGVKLYFPATDVRAELELASVELNAELDPALFRLTAGPE